MFKQKIMRGGLLIIIMIICLQSALALTYFSDDFSTNYADCDDHPYISTTSANCIIQDGVVKMSNSGTTARVFFELNPSIPSGTGKPTHTTSFIAKYNSFSETYGSSTTLSAIDESVAISSYSLGATGFMSINNQQTLLTASDFEDEWHSFDFVFNTTNDRVYVYIDGILRSNHLYANPNKAYDILRFIGYNYVEIDDLVIQDGVYVNTDYLPATCNDGIDNDGDGFIDYRYDPDCQGNPDNEEDVNNTYSGIIWSEEFDIPSSNCSNHDMFFEEITNFPTRDYSCSVSSGAMNLGLLNYRGYYGFTTRIQASDRKTKDYTLTYRLKLSATGSDTTSIFPSRNNENSDELSTLTWASANSYELQYQGTIFTGIDMTDYLDKWFVVDLYHNSSTNNVSLYIDGVYIASAQISDFNGANDISDLAFTNIKDGSSISSATQLKIDKIILAWGDTSGQESLTECTDGVDNDGDGFIDALDPDCVSGDSEDTFDLYPIELSYNVTYFQDHFDNNNYTSEGWFNDPDCIETTYLGNTVIKWDNADCTTYQTINLAEVDTSKEVFYYFDIIAFDKNDNYITLGKDSTNRLVFEIDQDGNELELKSFGTCSDSTKADYSIVWNTVSPTSIDFIHNITSSTLDVYINDLFIYSITDTDCLNEALDYIALNHRNDGMYTDYVEVSQYDFQYECYDGIDNDNDGYIDYPNDPDCVTPYEEEDTVNYHVCNDGIDNDNDGYTDYPDDIACTSPYGDTEFPKQGTACQDNKCTETENCILDFSFLCSTPITNFGFTTDPFWYGEFVTGELYNSRSVIGLHEFLGYNILLDNGSTDSTDEVIYFKEYTANTKDYQIINHKIDLFFDYQFANSGITENDISNEYIRYKFYNTNYIIQNKIFEVIIKPISINSEVVIKVYSVNQYGQENYIGSMRTKDSYDSGRIELNIDVDTEEQSYTIWWQDRLGISDESTAIDFDIFTYDYPDRMSFEVGGDPMFFSSQLRAESKMYLNNIKIYGKAKDTSTICTTWEKPYYFKEDFNGYIENCGWSVYPENLYFDGSLYIKQDLDIFRADKTFVSMFESVSRYATLDFTVNAYSYVETLGYTLVEMMDNYNEPVFAIYISKAEEGIGEIGYYSNGQFIKLSEFSFADTQRVYVIYDFYTDTFSLLTRGQYSEVTTIGSNLPIVKPEYNPTSISNIKIFGFRGEYRIDSIIFYTSDKEGNLVSLETVSKGEIFDPYPDMVGDSLCGYVVANQKSNSCLYDSECATGKCIKATGVCSNFDYTYCDENGHTRGNYCIVSAVSNCGLNKAKDIILNNFLLVLVFILVIMFVVYLVMIWRRS